MTRGVASGPHGDPARWDLTETFDVGYAHAADAVTDDEANAGLFERSISIFRCAYSFVSQSRGAKGKAAGYPAVLWVGQYAPHASSYVPVYVDADAVPAPSRSTLSSAACRSTAAHRPASVASDVVSLATSSSRACRMRSHPTRSSLARHASCVCSAS